MQRVMCMLLGIVRSTSIPNNMHYSDCDGGAFRIMSVPTDTAPDFVVVPTQIFRIGKIFFKMPPGSNSLQRLVKGSSLGRKDNIVPLLLRIGSTAAHEHPVAPIILPPVQDGHPNPIEAARALGPLAHREALPILVMKQQSFHFADFHLSALSISSQDPNGFIARY